MNYFVSYRASNLFGRCLITREKPVTCIEDVEEMEASIYQNQLKNGTFSTDGGKPLIINWQKFESPQ